MKILIQLTPAEYEMFFGGLSAGTHSRKLAQLIRCNHTISKDEIFKRVFKKNRSSINDHLLRNELSILKRKVENFIVEQSGTGYNDAPYMKPYLISYWCLKKGMIEQASLYADKSTQLAIQKNSMTGLLRINKLRLQIIQYSKSDYDYKIQELKNLQKTHLQYIQQLVAEEVRFADFIEAGAFKLSANLRKTPSTFKSTSLFETRIEENSDKTANYYYYKSLGYSEKGKPAIANLRKALLVLQEDTGIHNQDEERLTCMAAIAMEHALLGELLQAADVYNAIILQPSFTHFTPRHSLLFNYCTTLIKLKKYETALVYIEELEKQELEPIVKERIDTMKCNCYIFLGHLKKLKSILPQKLQSYDVSVRAYYRFLYTIYYLIKDEEELAKRELANIKNMKDFAQTEYGPLLDIFDKYVQAYTSKKYHEPRFRKHMRVLNAQADLFLKEHKEISELIPGMWIVEKAKNIGS